ncbi:hypothetical protein PVK06_028605 [Gossypium arboreum]|uniref:Uncharacterized protein n=1 Tax=Gossypium arboreum TaxID=29729 RepID=A0ABR0P3J7_GOSAR|nr:hypothetical protein PVK06_028605 [Gossypium arboreum]
MSSDMMVDLSSEQPILWKDKLVGQSLKDTFNRSKGKEDLNILEGDIQKSFVNGISAITFSDKIHQILIQGDMDMTLVERRLTQRKCLRKGKIGCERVGEDKRNLWAVDDC